MRALLEPEIRQSFVNCSRGTVKAMALPADFGKLRWDNLDFLGWYDPKTPARAYLVLPHGDQLVGMLLRAGDSSTPRRGSGLCSVCHCARMANEILLFAVPVAGPAGRAGNTVGTYMCADLQCSLYARGLLRLSLPQGETRSAAERSEQIQERLGGFVERVLAG